jgi:hypothetical protein
MTATSIVPYSDVSSTVSKTPSSSACSDHGITQTAGLCDEVMKNDDNNNVENENISVDDASGGEGNTSRSNSSGDRRSVAGDDVSTLSRREVLASKETRAVTKLKQLVFGSLFCSLLAVVLTAFLTSQSEHST